MPIASNLSQTVESSASKHTPDTMLRTLTNPESLDNSRGTFTTASLITLSADTGYFVGSIEPGALTTW